MNKPVLAKEIFDRLRQATAGNPEVLAELCRDYVFEARNALAQMQQAMDRADAGRLRERAHYLKGSSMMIGAHELSACCATLEQMGRDAQLAAAGPELARAMTALKTVEAELSQEFGPAILPEEGTAA